MPLNGLSLSSEFGDGLPHSLGRVPQKQFFVFPEFLGTSPFNFFKIWSVEAYFDPLSESAEKIRAKVPRDRAIRGQSWGHDGASRFGPAHVAVLQPTITNLHTPVADSWAYILVPIASRYVKWLGSCNGEKACLRSS